MRMPGFVRGFFNWIRRLVKAFLDGDCPMHAAGLTYYVLLSVVPILCCILVAAKTCHIDSFARDQINGKIDALIVNIEKGQDDVLSRRFRSSTRRSARRSASRPRNSHAPRDRSRTSSSSASSSSTSARSGGLASASSCGR